LATRETFYDIRFELDKFHVCGILNCFIQVMRKIIECIRMNVFGFLGEGKVEGGWRVERLLREVS
jgi:hypothetical protein